MMWDLNSRRPDEAGLSSADASPLRVPPARLLGRSLMAAFLPLFAELCIAVFVWQSRFVQTNLLGVDLPDHPVVEHLPFPPCDAVDVGQKCSDYGPVFFDNGDALGGAVVFAMIAIGAFYHIGEGDLWRGARRHLKSVSVVALVGLLVFAMVAGNGQL